MYDDLKCYSDLRNLMHEALLDQHPEWIESNGESPTIDIYDARLAELLGLFDLREDEAA